VNPRVARASRWTAALLGILAVLQVISRALPRENRIRIDLPLDATVKQVGIELADVAGEIWRTAELGIPSPNPRWIEYVVTLPPGEYRVSTTYELIQPVDRDKDHGMGSTLVGLQHQIRLEGEDHHLPPPKHEAK
jgi:hypothetical protein